MKHTFPQDNCIQDLTIGQRLARMFLKSCLANKLALGRRLAYEVLGYDGRGRLNDYPVEEVDSTQPTVPWNEPVFLLRAQDPFAVETIRAWLVLAEKEGLPKELLDLVRDQIKEMEAWPIKKFAELHQETPEEETK